MKKKIALWLVVSLIIGGVVSIIASSHPDGFEKAGEEVGYIGKSTSYFHSLLANYTLLGSDSWLSTGIAGFLGVILTFGIFLLIGRLVSKKTV